MGEGAGGYGRRSRPYRFQWALVVLSTLVMGCSRVTVVRAPGSLYYPDVVAGRIAYATPVVTASRVSYQDSHTGERYHHSDRNRTRGALLREMRFLVDRTGLDWHPLEPSTDSAVAAALAEYRGVLDSLPSGVVSLMPVVEADAVVVLYDVRLVHEHSVGTDIPLPEVASFSAHVRKALQYKCAVIDLATNRQRFFGQVAIRERGDALTVVERGIEALFEALLRTRSGGRDENG